MAKRQLLLVEDNPQHLRVMEVSLRKAGFAVTTATNGAQARSKLSGPPPALIVSDTAMPGQDGFELCRWVRENPNLQDIPFIFVTDDASAESRVHGLELGADDYLTRPIYSRELTTRVEMALERRERQRLKQGPEQRRFYGDLQQMSVTDLLQAMEMGKKYGAMLIEGDGVRAKLVFSGGRVVDAVTGELRGDEAVYRVLSWDRGSFEIHFGPQPGETTVTQSTEALLMEGMRRLDQWSRVSEQLPPLDEIYRVDYDELAANLAGLPDEVNGLLRLFEGGNSIERCVQLAPMADVEALSVISQLVFSGVIYRASDRPAPAEPGGRAPVTPPPVPQSIADALLESATQLPAVTVEQPAQRLTRQRAALETREGPQIRVERTTMPAVAPETPLAEPRMSATTLPSSPVQPEAPIADPASADAPRAEAPIDPFDEDLADVEEETLFPSLGDAFEDEVDDFFGPGAEDIGLSVAEDDPISFDGLEGFGDEEEPASARPFQFALGLLLLIVAFGVSFIFLQNDIEPRQVQADSLHTGWHDKELSKRARVTQVAAFDAGWRIPSEPDGGVALAVEQAPVVDGGAEAAAASEDKPAEVIEAVEKPAELVAPEASPKLKKSARVLTAEGVKLHQKGKYAQAVQRFEKALALTPTEKTTLLAYTKSLLEVNRLRDALAAAEKVSQVDPKNPEVYLLLGNSRQDLGFKSGAIEAYERYLALSPNGKFAVEVQQVIKGLKAAGTN